ncbi:MAG: hypothetical protein LBB40_04395 [Holophagales bacterium]|jgi:hypothetical protein|nr:hypothetical protein [Holophagales bacterium]
MTISLFIKPNDVSRVDLRHPDTREKIGTLLIAGPDHEATKTWKRDINDRREKRGYKPDADAEVKESLCRRTVGWEDVKDLETGESIPFDTGILPSLYSQSWLLGQVLNEISEEGFFFRE